MVDPVHPEFEPEPPKKAKVRIIVISEFDLDPDNYMQVEWPPGLGEKKNLTDPEEMLEFERFQLAEGESDYMELLDIGHISDENVRLELVPETPEESTEIVDANLKAMGSIGLSTDRQD